MLKQLDGNWWKREHLAPSDEYQETCCPAQILERPVLRRFSDKRKS
jgi:hypothetical protein